MSTGIVLGVPRLYFTMQNNVSKKITFSIVFTSKKRVDRINPPPPIKTGQIQPSKQRFIMVFIELEAQEMKYLYKYMQYFEIPLYFSKIKLYIYICIYIS